MGGRKPTKIKQAYFKKNKVRVREEYIKHIHKFAIYSRYDVLINSEAYQKLLKEKNQLQEELSQMKEDNAMLKSEVQGIQKQIDDIAKVNDVSRIQEFVVDDDFVNQHNLGSMIMNLYREDVEEDKLLVVTNDYLDELKARAYNILQLSDSENTVGDDEDDVTDKEYIELKNRMITIKDKYIGVNNLMVPKSKQKLLDESLDEYLANLWLNHNLEPDENHICELIQKIVINR